MNAATYPAVALVPSARSELGGTNFNRRYLEAGAPPVELVGRSVAWFGAGTHDSFLRAYLDVRGATGLKVACPTEIALKAGWIDAEALAELVETLYDDFL